MRALGLLIAAVLLLALFAPAAAPAAGMDPGRLCGEGLDVHRLKGKPMGRAERLARRHECVVRTVRLNGLWLSVTQDYVTNRINVAVRDGTVKRVLGIY
jgi:hypothetical protein